MNSTILPTEKEMEYFYYNEIKPSISEDMDITDALDIITSIKNIIKKYVLLNQPIPDTSNDQSKTERTHENAQRQ
jgi:hypothetical protein